MQRGNSRQKSFNSLYEVVKCRPFVNVVLKCILVILLTFVINYSIRFQLIDHCKLLVVYILGLHVCSKKLIDNIWSQLSDIYKMDGYFPILILISVALISTEAFEANCRHWCENVCRARSSDGCNCCTGTSGIGPKNTDGRYRYDRACDGNGMCNSRGVG